MVVFTNGKPFGVTSPLLGRAGNGSVCYYGPDSVQVLIDVAT